VWTRQITHALVLGAGLLTQVSGWAQADRPMRLKARAENFSFLYRSIEPGSAAVPEAIDEQPGTVPDGTGLELMVAASSDADILARLIEAEAGGGAYQGKVAVGAVVMNRLRARVYGRSVYEVVMSQKDGCQFSPVCDGRYYSVTPSKASHQAAQAALNGQDPTGGATHFYAPSKVSPKWARTMHETTTIGNHRFLKR